MNGVCEGVGSSSNEGKLQKAFVFNILNTELYFLQGSNDTLNHLLSRAKLNCYFVREKICVNFMSI